MGEMKICENMWNVIKNKLNIKFHSQPIYQKIFKR